MSWTGARSAIDANLALAAADVTPAIPTVIDYEPDSLAQDTLAHWPEGSRPSTTGGNTLIKVNIERAIRVTGYLLAAARTGSQNAEIEARLVALEEALFIRLWADAGCGGHAIGLSIDETAYGWTDIGGQLARTITFLAWIDLPEVATIAL
jgi:hypothetical protein